jgi:hypothetical protein
MTEPAPLSFREYLARFRAKPTKGSACALLNYLRRHPLALLDAHQEDIEALAMASDMLDVASRRFGLSLADSMMEA